MSSRIPTHFSDEKNKGLIIMAIGGFASLILLVHLIQFAPIITYLAMNDFNAETWSVVGKFFGGYYNPQKFGQGMKYAFNLDTTYAVVSTLVMVVISAVPVGLAAMLNPFRMYDLIHGDARRGTLRDIREMENRKQVGIKGGNYLTLGEWQQTKEPVRLIETLSVLVLAPPGTGKTASFVVPSILETDESSFIVNDPKPELFDLTSGWRREIGHVFKIDWSATDDTRDADPANWVFYPRFNVLSPKLLPPAGSAERDTYLDAIANVLSPDGGGGGKNDYFEQKGRAALVGFLHYLCSKIVDAGNMEGLPAKWRDAQEPCIPMMIDLVNEGLRRASDENDAKKEEAAKTGGFHQGDALSDWLKAIVKECMDFGYNPRAATEITPLVSMAPNERSGILGTMDKAFLPFKNAAVQERTTSCDFVPADLRGMVDPTDGEMKPVTLYMCVNQAEAAAFATITSLVYEVLSREFLAYEPGATNKKGVTLGPYPVCFMLDEFAKLPKIEAVMTGPDLGRSKKTYYCLIAQSDSQIGKIYSKEDQQIIYATTAVKYVLPQNDEGTISLIQKMVGSTTIKRSSFSKSRGADMKEWGKSNESIALEKVDFIRPGDISAMKSGTHMLICQGFMSRPYTLKSKMFFQYPDLLAKAFNPRTKLGPRPAPPLPDFVRERRIAEVMAKRAAPVATLYSSPYDEHDGGRVDLGKRAA
jgi:type IV secretion system protein VirD4